MDQKQMEKVILKKLSKGLLDGPVGDDFVTGEYATAGAITRELFDTDEKKLAFFQ